MRFSSLYTTALSSEFGRLAILVSALALFACEGKAQNFRTVRPGVEYAEMNPSSPSPQKIHLLRIDLTRVRIDVHHALDRAVGLETTSSIAKRKQAIAAINAGFFRLDASPFAGDPAGIMLIDGRLWSESDRDRAAVMIRNDRRQTNVWFARPNVRAAITFGRKQIAVDGINRQARPGDRILVYTPAFGPATPTSAESLEYIVDRNTRRSQGVGGGSRIPRNGFVVAMPGGPARIAVEYRRDARIRLIDRPFARSAAPVEDAVGGVPQLIKDARVDITWREEGAARSFAELRHPRTAIAKLKDGKLLMITVDGRQPGVSEGMSLKELAHFLLSLGSVDAINLDGGGSTTMYVDGRIVNTPSDKAGERKVSDAIVITSRTNSRGTYSDDAREKLDFARDVRASDAACADMRNTPGTSKKIFRQGKKKLDKFF